MLSRKISRRLSRTRSRRNPPRSSATTAELASLGETFRRRRLQRGVSLDDAAAELGLPSSSLRAIEWDRRDLLGNPHDVDRIEREYAAFLGMDARGPTGEATRPDAGGPTDEASEAAPARRRLSRAAWTVLLAGLAPPLVVGLVYALGEVMSRVGDSDRGGLTFGEYHPIPLALALASSLLLVGAVLPTALIERTPASPESFARYRQPLALAGIGILVSVVVFMLLVALT